MANKIGIIGFAGAGKDTVANIMMENCSGLKVVRFAAPIKRIAKGVFGDNFDDRSTKETRTPFTPLMKATMMRFLDIELMNLHPHLSIQQQHQIFANAKQTMMSISSISSREFQQLIGTEVCRSVVKDIWLIPVAKDSGNLVCPDVRFENEFAQFDKIVLVNSPHVTPNLNHESELLADKLLNQTHSKYPCKLSDMRSSGFVGNHMGKPVYMIYNAYSIERLCEIVHNVLES